MSQTKGPSSLITFVARAALVAALVLAGAIYWNQRRAAAVEDLRSRANAVESELHARIMRIEALAQALPSVDPPISVNVVREHAKAMDELAAAIFDESLSEAPDLSAPLPSLQLNRLLEEYAQIYPEFARMIHAVEHDLSILLGRIGESASDLYGAAMSAEQDSKRGHEIQAFALESYFGDVEMDRLNTAGGMFREVTMGVNHDSKLLSYEDVVRHRRHYAEE